jgi:hypothetical protein
MLSHQTKNVQNLNICLSTYPTTRAAMNMKHETDTWTDEAFDDAIARAMLALYESKIYHKSANNRSRSLTPDLLNAIRKEGVLIPAPDRVYQYAGDGRQMVDTNVKMIGSGCFSFGEDRRLNDPDSMSGYCRIEYFRRLSRIPRTVRMIVPGQPYEMVSVFATDHGEIEGVRQYLTINPAKGSITPCVELDRSNIPLSLKIKEAMSEDNSRSVSLLNYSFQIVDDFQHQWRITALDDKTKVTVGAYTENVKSLLYARSLPVTPSGRKRPILHVVSAHRRRMKEGVDVDIKTFLRGTREIEMGGMKYIVEAPQRLIDELLTQALSD